MACQQPWASLPMATPPRQKSNQGELSIESGKFLKLSSQVLDIRVHLNSTFGVEYFELNSEIRRNTGRVHLKLSSRVNPTSRVFLSSSNSKASSIEFGTPEKTRPWLLDTTWVLLLLRSLWLLSAKLSAALLND